MFIYSTKTKPQFGKLIISTILCYVHKIANNYTKENEILNRYLKKETILYAILMLYVYSMIIPCPRYMKTQRKSEASPPVNLND